jgi:general secretion pathway protein M
MAMWQKLSKREQVILGLGISTGLLIIIYLMILEPLGKDFNRLQRKVPEQEQLLLWMEAASGRVKQLRKNNVPGKTKKSTGSPLATIDLTIKQSKLGKAMTRIEPDQKNGVRVWFEKAEFDALYKWLNKLEQQYGFTVKYIMADRQDSPGIINARLTLVQD